MKSIIRTLILPSLLLFSCSSPSSNSRIDLSETAKAPAAAIPVAMTPVDGGTTPPAKKNVQLSILLDTSNSMDGLINQAKSQLWNIVNELAESTYDGETPNLYIALYEYGNDGLPMTSGYIRQVTEFTEDMDIVSRDLFSLTTNGGSEYCGHVINTSLDELQWTEGDSDLKIIYIAGNEEFTQGLVSFRQSCKKANERDIVVNTIYCGEMQEGIRTSWKEGADLTGGEYFAINSDAVTVQVASPYDQRIGELNYALNDTYIYYGDQGLSGYANCTTQDDNAKGSGWSSFNGRNKFKASSNYRNTSWNLIDLEGDALADTLKFIDNSTLPGEYQEMGADELLETVKLKQEEKEKIQAEMSELIQKREAFVKEQMEDSGEENELEDAMLKSIRKQAEKKKLSFDKGC